VLNLQTGATGEARVGIVSADHHNLPGFSVIDCDLINGDFFEKPVTWNGRSPFSALEAKTIRLRFVMRGTSLYGFQFKN